MRSLLVVLLLAGACSKNNEPPPPSSGSPNAKPESGPRGAGGAPAQSAAERAQKMYATVCQLCHGAEGKGDGQAAASLNPKPRNYTDPAWQASVTDEDLKKIILLGGQGVGKSSMMPGQPQLEQDPEVLNELVKIIRGFKK